MDKYDWLETAKQLDAIAQAGLTYNESDYDLDRYRQIREISHKILNHYTGISFERLPDLFSNETGYQTPKVDVRGVIIQHNKVLMVKKKLMGTGLCQEVGLILVFHLKLWWRKRFGRRLV
ncbi:NUDIX hydrolase N-terminal domain-containing protein [Bacteroidota bacterium]